MADSLPGTRARRWPALLLLAPALVALVYGLADELAANLLRSWSGRTGQVAYGAVSAIACVAIYLYGVGVWSPWAAPPASPTENLPPMGPAAVPAAGAQRSPPQAP